MYTNVMILTFIAITPSFLLSFLPYFLPFFDYFIFSSLPLFAASFNTILRKNSSLATLKKPMKVQKGGSHPFMKSAPLDPDDRLLAVIGYKYRYQKALCFIATEGDRSTEPGVTYLSHYPENHSNVSICSIFCPRTLSGI